MARPKRQTWVVRQLLGMNEVDPEISLLPGQARMIQNVDLFESGLGEKRAGFQVVPTTGTTPTVGAAVSRIFKHSPDGLDSSAELWVRKISGNGVYRWAAGAWSFVTFADVPQSTLIEFATFNHKLFMAYDSAINRLHVWDGVSVRRAGLAPPAVAPGLANLGAGALAFTRFYRVRFRANVGTPITALTSEAGPSASITVAASSGVQVARPALVDGNEQAWDIEVAAAANGPWFILAQVAIGTLTFNDTSATIPTVAPAPEAGLFTLPPSAKYLAVYQNQIIMAGAWETATTANGQSIPKNNRVWYTRPLGALEISDDEAITTTLTQKFYVDTGEDNGRITGLSYPLEGVPFVFKATQLWSLIPTDSDTAPFRVVRMTDAVGCSRAETIVIGEDENGNPALYWNSIRGPYRIGRNGTQFLGRDLHPLNAAFTAALWVPERRQVWWVTAAQAKYFVFNVRFGRPENGDVRYGWTQATTTAPPAVGAPTVSCFGLFNRQFGAGEPTSPQEPLLGGFDPAIGGPLLWQRDPGLQQDAGNNYGGSITFTSDPLGEFLRNVLVYPPRVYAEPRIATTAFQLNCSVVGNLGGPPMGTSFQSSVIALGSVNGIGTFEGINWSDGEVYTFSLGDSLLPIAEQDQAWRLNAFLVPYQLAEEAE